MNISNIYIYLNIYIWLTRLSTGWVGGEKRKTKVIKKELNPEWKEKFDLVVSGAPPPT